MAAEAAAVVVVVDGLETVPGSVPGTMPETTGVHPDPDISLDPDPDPDPDPDHGPDHGPGPGPVPVLGASPCSTSSTPVGVSVTSLRIDR